MLDHAAHYFGRGTWYFNDRQESETCTSTSPIHPLDLTARILQHRGLKLDGAIGQGKFLSPSKGKIFQNPSCPILEEIK